MNNSKPVSELIGEFWTKSDRVKTVNWWDLGYINKRINQHVNGVDSEIQSEGLNQLLLSKLGGRRLNTGVSVGCGDGVKEMRLLELGIVDRFILFDFSNDRVKRGAQLAKQRGLSGRLEFHTDDAFEFDFSGVPIELAHWNNSLHHMFDVYEAVKWSHDLLQPGGVFYMDDFVGPSRFRWPDYMLDIANEVLPMIPQAYEVREGDRIMRTFVARGCPEQIDDPSEAADSERILDAVRCYFPQAEITNTGGLIYFLALGLLWPRFDINNPEHMDTVREIMDIDLLYARHPHVGTLYAAALAFK